MERHNPFPAIVLDRHWNVVRLNAAAEMVFEMLGVAANVNMIDVFVHDPELRDLIVNRSEVGYHLLTRLRTESAAIGGDAILDAAIAALAADEEISAPTGSELPVAVPSIFQVGDLRVSLVSTIAQFGSAEDITLADQRIELFFPNDETTRELFVSLQTG